MGFHNYKAQRTKEHSIEGFLSLLTLAVEPKLGVVIQTWNLGEFLKSYEFRLKYSKDYVHI